MPRLDLTDRKVGEGDYRLGRALGRGAFGEIFLASTRTGDEVAVKVERARTRRPVLLHEARILQMLQGAPGIAVLHHFGSEGDLNIMVTELLGPSLEDLFVVQGHQFSLKTVAMLAEQMLYRIEYIHNRGLLHRDIKPDNFLIGSGRRCNTVYLIDFGLAKRYRALTTGQHMAPQEGKTFIGTARYAPVNAQLGRSTGRRDEMESLGYVLVYFLRGKLPWQGLEAETREEKQELILRCKRETPLDQLCEGLQVMYSFLSYCRALRFEDKPDYAYLRRLFKDLFMKEGLVMDGMFDWSQPMSSERPQTSGSQESLPSFVGANGCDNAADSTGVSSLFDTSNGKMCRMPSSLSAFGATSSERVTVRPSPRAPISNSGGDQDLKHACAAAPAALPVPAAAPKEGDAPAAGRRGWKVQPRALGSLFGCLRAGRRPDWDVESFN